MKPAASRRCTSSAMTSRRSSLKGCNDCLTGRSLGSVLSLCSASSLGTPGMSDELHERAFLCWDHARPDRHRLAGVAWDQLDGAGVCRCLEGSGVATLRIGLLEYDGVVVVDPARV